MRAIDLSLLLLLVVGAGPAAGQTCPTTGALNRAGIRNALGEKWACAKDGADMWNQRIATGFTGTFAECHSGLATGADPIDNNKGTFVISNTTGPGAIDTITYTYPPSGGSYTYRVYEVTAGSVYTFCRPSDSKNYTVRISTCPPASLNNCP